MKILILDDYYSLFLEAHYKAHPELENKNYLAKKDSLLNQLFGTANFYSKNLINHGAKAEEIIINDEILQKQWAKENNVKYFKGYFKNIPKIRHLFKSNWQEKILEAQILSYKPDVLYCQSLYAPGNVFLSKIKPHIPLIVGQVASPVIFDKNKLSAFDLILTSFPHFVDKFKQINIKSEYFKIGFEKDVLKSLQSQPTKHDSVFVGGISKHHLDIINTFEYLSTKTKIDFWGYGKRKLDPNSPILKTHHGEAWGVAMYNILHNSKISINRHINVAENNANNMRLYESTGVGSMLITDYKDNLHELFEIGKEIETYKTKEELLEKINYYLEHDYEREKIAKAGQLRTLSEHTYEIRMKELLNILNKYL